MEKTMKKSIVILFSFLTLMGSGLHSASKKSMVTSKALGDTSLLDFYRQYSSFTDPGEYEYVYENLPESLSELCRLIKTQTIHPNAELPNYRNLIPEERWDEIYRYPTVKSILEGLLSYDSRGLVSDRKVKDRLVLGCRENAIILASILKYRGVPARVRCGHATYLIQGFHASHTLCEVWNENDKRWMLVDPSVNRIDFNKEEFDFSNELWLKMQTGEIDPNVYGFPGQYTGLISILGKVPNDLASILGAEYPHYQYSPILDYASNNDNQLTAEQIELLNEISELMKSIDAENFSKLQDIYNNNPQIQVTLSFVPTSVNIENDRSVDESLKLSHYSLSQNYPNPFNPNTKISFSIPKAGNVTINIYNTLGETVETRHYIALPMGMHVIDFHANQLPSGVYYFCMEAGEFKHVKKMTLLQ
jgi:hypothetical protein